MPRTQFSCDFLKWRQVENLNSSDISYKAIIEKAILANSLCNTAQGLNSKIQSNQNKFQFNT